jgi:hypothetical protein
MIGQSKTGTEKVKSNQITLFFSGRCFAVTQQTVQKMLGHNHLAEPNWHVLIFLYPIMILEAQQQTRPDKPLPPPKSSPMGRGPAGVSSAHHSV